MLREFRDFLMKGNIVSLAVAFVIGVAFAAVVNSLVNDLIMPIVAMITTIQKFHGCPVSGSSLLASETMNPPSGRMSSDGSGIIADSIPIASITPM